MSEPVDSYTDLTGVEIEIFQDEDPPDPRTEYDNVGTIVWIRDVNTKDYDLKDEMAGIWREDMMMMCPACRGEGEFLGPRSRDGSRTSRTCSYCDTNGEVPTDDIVKWFKNREPDAHLIIPIYFNDRQYDGSVSIEDADTANGVIWVSKADIEKEWGTGAAATKKARKYLEGEIETYNLYCGNETYYVVATLDGETESLGGCLGMEHAKDTAQDLVGQLVFTVEKENAEREFWLARDVVTV